MIPSASMRSLLDSDLARTLGSLSFNALIDVLDWALANTWLAFGIGFASIALPLLLIWAASFLFSRSLALSMARRRFPLSFGALRGVAYLAIAAYFLTVGLSGVFLMSFSGGAMWLPPIAAPSR